jgi:HSP20 family protein
LRLQKTLLPKRLVERLAFKLHSWFGAFLSGGFKVNISKWEPLKELQRLREQTDQLWDVYLRKLAGMHEMQNPVSFLPEVDIVDTAHDVRVLISIPGILEDDIELSATPESLTIRGERESPYDPGRSHLREWRYGFFERTLSLPSRVNIDTIRAEYEAGVLTVVLAKSASEKKGR